MSDVKTRILEILQQPRLACLATVTQDGKPWVRYVMTATSPDLTIRCAEVIDGSVPIRATAVNATGR